MNFLLKKIIYRAKIIIYDTVAVRQLKFYFRSSFLYTNIILIRIIMKATYVKTSLKSIVSISKIVTIHYYEFDSSFVFEGESHDFWEMVYVDGGRVRVRSGEEECELTQGDVIFHAPNEFHSIRALDSSPNFFVISFVCPSPSMDCLVGYRTTLDKNLKAFISSIIKEAENSFVIPKNDPKLRKLTKKKDAALGGEQLIKNYLEELLILLMRGIAKHGTASLFPSKESMENHLVTAVKSYIEENVYENPRLTDICRALGYSKSYLSKLFREQTGESIAGYVIKNKIKKAKQLIREGDMNFSEISDKLAFDNPQYFSRVFKRETSMTPSEFMRSLSFKD